jgi:hypothetical protein
MNLFSRHLRQCGPLHLAFRGELTDACTNIQQVAEEEDTPHVDTGRNARVWIDFLGGLPLMTNFMI